MRALRQRLRVRFPKMPLGSWPERATPRRRSTVTRFCSQWWVLRSSSALQIVHQIFGAPDCFRSSSILRSSKSFQILFSRSCLLLPADLFPLFFKYFSSLRNLSSTWLNSSISALELESLRVDFVTELKFQRLEMLVSYIISKPC